MKTIAGGRPPTPEEEAGFVGPLDAEVEKINAFFLDQEEEFVICHQQLQEEIMRVVVCKAASVQHEAEATSVRREVVNFHGEMVLLLNYSSVNYIGRTSINRKKDWILVTFS
jgi:SPX domain protein involved in polyphosphate accumulation